MKGSAELEHAISLLRLFVCACIAKDCHRTSDGDFNPVIGQSELMAAKRLCEELDRPFHIGSDE